ncbi:MAG: tRNA (guanosine(46)-N7)-methyltransferase TrmB [Bacteroidota bacterium]|nr:tRNA (guanosine(46)-N7)-methyltransferase TrmB [Bacteroidota bacterium]
MTRQKKIKFNELATFDNAFESPNEMKAKWNSDYFKNNNSIILELGCGKGEYTNELAKRFPDKNFIGVDIKGVRLWRGAKDAIIAKLQNVAFVRILIQNITEIFDKNEIAEIWIPFPDPFPRPSKWRRRLVSSLYLNYYKDILIKNGIINFKTDDTDLYKFGLKTLQEEKHEIIEYTDNLYNSSILNEYNSITTYFEKIHREKGETIKYIKFRLK